MSRLQGLLNPNQQRKLATDLRLLSEDLEAAAGEAEPIARLVDDIRNHVRVLREAFHLPPGVIPPAGRRLSVMAQAWAARMEDLRPARLRGYGPVHPELPPHLDPHLDRLRELLTALAAAIDGGTG